MSLEMALGKFVLDIAVIWESHLQGSRMSVFELDMHSGKTLENSILLICAADRPKETLLIFSL